MKIIKFITKKLSDPDPLIIDRIRIRPKIIGSGVDPDPDPDPHPWGVYRVCIQ